MARKKLLSEGEIRQFMKLANLRPISKVRLSEMGDHAYPGARDDEDEEMALGDEEMALGDEEMAMDDEEMAMDDEEMAMDDAGGGDPEKEQMLADVVMAVADALGISDQVDVEGAPAEEEEVEMDAEIEMGPEGGEEMELGAEEEMMAEVVRRVMEAIDLRKSPDNPLAAGTPARRQKYGGNEGDIPDADRKKKGHHGSGPKRKQTAKEEGEVDLEEGATEDEIVNEVAKRVAARLQAESRKEQMVDTLAERIMRRLTK